MVVRRNFRELARRRSKAEGLLIKGYSQAEIARLLEVSRQSVSRWSRQRLTGGNAAAGRAGRKPRLNGAQEGELLKLLSAGPEASGFPTRRWTLKWVARLIRDR